MAVVVGKREQSSGGAVSSEQGSEERVRERERELVVG
jgi:hypothetical protein